MPATSEQRLTMQQVIALAVAIVVIVVGLFLGSSGDSDKTTADAISDNQPQRIPISSQTASATPLRAATDPCDDVFSREEQIDNGSNRDAPGKIQVVDAKHVSADYKKLKQCWRNERIGQDKPHFQYGAVYRFRNAVRVGMTQQEFVDALPLLPKEVPEIPSETNIFENPYALDWVEEKCWVPEKPAMNAAIACLFSKPITYAFRASSHAPFSDNITVEFDKNAPDGKLLTWDLMFSMPVASYKSTDEVIRDQRGAALIALGPPDEADSHHAVWYFSDNKWNLLLTVDLSVVRMGDAFEARLLVTDAENQDKPTPVAQGVTP